MKLYRIKFTIITILLALAFNTHTMDNPEKPKPSKLKWATLAGGVLIGAVPLHRFLSYVNATTAQEPAIDANPIDSIMSSESGSLSSTGFDYLPTEVQQMIVLLLPQYNSATTLAEAVRTIRALALTSKALDSIINNSHICLLLIKTLSRKFKYSDMHVALALNTRGAKERMNLQGKIFHHIKEPLPYGIDLDFTYDTEASKDITPLMINCTKPFNKTKEIEILLANHANINYQNNNGDTVLTWLVQAIASSETSKVAGSILLHLELILNNGADPNIKNNDGLTALDMAQEIDDGHPQKQDVIKLLKAAIKKEKLNKI